MSFSATIMFICLAVVVQSSVILEKPGPQIVRENHNVTFVWKLSNTSNRMTVKVDQVNVLYWSPTINWVVPEYISKYRILTDLGDGEIGFTYMNVHSWDAWKEFKLEISLHNSIETDNSSIIVIEKIPTAPVIKHLSNAPLVEGGSLNMTCTGAKVGTSPAQYARPIIYEWTRVGSDGRMMSLQLPIDESRGGLLMIHRLGRQTTDYQCTAREDGSSLAAIIKEHLDIKLTSYAPGMTTEDIFSTTTEDIFPTTTGYKGFDEYIGTPKHNASQGYPMSESRLYIIGCVLGPLALVSLVVILAVRCNKKRSAKTTEKDTVDIEPATPKDCYLTPINVAENTYCDIEIYEGINPNLVSSKPLTPTAPPLLLGRNAPLPDVPNDQDFHGYSMTTNIQNVQNSKAPDNDEHIRTQNVRIVSIYANERPKISSENQYQIESPLQQSDDDVLIYGNKKQISKHNVRRYLTENASEVKEAEPILKPSRKSAIF